MRSLALLLSIGCCLASGCSAPLPSPSSDQVVVAPSPATTRKVTAPTVSLISVAPIKELALDGDLREWGDLKAGPETNDVHPPPGFPVFDILGSPWNVAQVDDARNPGDANARVAVSWSSDKVALAVDFGDSGLQEVSVALAVRSDDVKETSETLLEGASSQDNVRAWRLSTRGIERLQNNHFTAVSGTKSVMSADGRFLEATIPNSALPGLADAPLIYVLMAVSFDAEAHRDYFSPPFRWVKLKEPVHYEPYADIRERVIEKVLNEGPAGGSTIRYSPDNPGIAQSFNYQPPASNAPQDFGIGPHDQWYVKKGTLGDVEVGLGYASAPYVAVMKGGHLTDLALLTREEEGRVQPKDFTESDGIVRAVVERNDEVDVISNAVSSYHALYTGAFMGAHWTVSRVDRQGKITTWYCEEPAFGDRMLSGIGSEAPYFDAHYTQFGWRAHFDGSRFPDKRARVRDLACRWDEKAKTYKSKLTFVPPIAP